MTFMPMRCAALVVLIGLSVPAWGQQPDPVVLREEYRQYSLENEGNVEAGKTLFETDKKLVCINCHLVTGMERTGPNLDGVADRYPKAELLKHILEPNAFIKPGYEHVTIALKDGKVLSGRITRTTLIEYRIVDAQGTVIRVPKTDIEEMKALPTSLMPDNVVASISKEQFADLVAYLGTLHLANKTGYIGPDQPIEIPKISKPLTLTPIHPAELKFDNPLWCGDIPGTDRQMLVMEHMQGNVWRLDRTQSPPKKELFLSLHGMIEISPNQGLQSIAFHPDFVENRRYFIKHQLVENQQVKSVVVERLATKDLKLDSGRPSIRIIEQVMPGFNHNGGCIGFGPDGMLYTAFGDGGPQKDPTGVSQNPRDYLGSMLRIDVDRQENGRNYAIPADNPFVSAHQQDKSIQAETWAIGFREPWRFSFDPATGAMWGGDVGQETYEEVSIVRRGDNHGWNVYESYFPFSEQYRRTGETYVPPVFAYSHGVGFSITGGHVYRKDVESPFYGIYIFGDYETRKIWGLKLDKGKVEAVRELAESPEHISSFGLDNDGNIYFTGYEGTVFQVELSSGSFDRAKAELVP